VAIRRPPDDVNADNRKHGVVASTASIIFGATPPAARRPDSSNEVK
jgi:hypothetical protein